MSLTDDDIAERIVKHLRSRHSDLTESPAWIVSDYLDEAEVYLLAYVPGVQERAKVRRQARRVRRIVFAKLGVGDGAAAGK